MNPEYRRKQIMEVAKKVFATHGYQKTNIDMICKKAGTGRGTIYRYFKNKEAIFALTLESSLEEMNRKMIEGYDFNEDPNNNKEEMLEAYAKTTERVLSVWLADRDFAKIMFEVSAGVSERFTEIRQEFDRKNLSLIKAMFDQFKLNDLVRPDLDSELAAVRLRGATEKIMANYLLDQKKKITQEQVRELARKSAELDLLGMLTPEAIAAGS